MIIMMEGGSESESQAHARVLDLRLFGRPGGLLGPEMFPGIAVFAVTKLSWFWDGPVPVRKLLTTFMLAAVQSWSAVCESDEGAGPR